MSARLVCPQGHQWENAAGNGAAQTSAPVCPVCGVIAAGAPVATDPWETVAAGSAAPGSHSTIYPDAATLPFESPPSAPGEAPGRTIIAGYEVLGVLGRGAMGVVYRARQLALNREVALKMVLSGSHASAQDRARFLAEAEAAASLQHPNIVQVYEVGAHDGCPFYSMQLVEGGSVAAKAAGAPLQPRDAAALVEKLARAMQYAHTRGIIHRDLKPANVLLTADGEPKIADFGLAKRLDDDPNATEARYATQSGAAVGTPSYMAPEQVVNRGVRVGPLADVYALGAVLYDLLAGRPPFVADSVLSTLEMVVSDEPPPPSRWQRRLPNELVTICLKCLRKEPDKRYCTAGLLADDLQRFLAGEPIQAVPVGRLERTVKWARRRPAAAALVAVSVFATLLVFWGSIDYNVQLNRALDEAQAGRTSAVDRLINLNDEKGMDLVDSGHLSMALPLLVEAMRIKHATNLEAGVDPDDGSARGAQAAVDKRLRRLRLAQVLQSSPRLLRIWYHDEPAFDASFSPDGRQAVSAGADHVAFIRNIISSDDVGVTLRHNGAVFQAGFSPDGKRVLTACADGAARVWDAADGRLVCRSPQHGGAVSAANFSADGRRFCTASADGTARVCDAGTGQELLPPLRHAGPVRLAAFSPDGRLLLTAAEQTARLWKVTAGQPADLQQELRHDGQVLTAAFDRDGARVVTGASDNQAVVWEVVSRRRLASLKHERAVAAVCFSPDGASVGTASDDGSARVWNSSTGEAQTESLRHHDRVLHLAFSPNGRLLVTGSCDNTALVWDVARGVPYSQLLRANGNVSRIRFSPDGRYVLSASESGAVRLWEPIHAFRTSRPTALHALPFASAKSTDGRLEVVSADGVVLQVREVQTGKLVGPAFQPGGVVFAAVFSPDGSRLLTAGSAGRVQLWDPITATRLSRVPLTHGSGSPVLCGAFSPDGEYLATGSSDNTARVWHAATGEPRTPFMPHDATVFQVAFSPDSHCLLTASEDGCGRLWSASTGARLSPHLDLEGWVKEAFERPRDPAAWKLTPEVRPLDELQAEAEWLSGHRIDQKTGGLISNSREEFLDLAARVRARYPQILTFKP